jgi:hypothetical protein
MAYGIYRLAAMSLMICLFRLGLFCERYLISFVSPFILVMT